MNYLYIVKDNDMFGRDLLRSDRAVPLAFRPTIEHTVRQSANKNNNNTTVEAIVPQMRIVDGLTVSTDAFKATFKFTALQHISNDDDANLAIDSLLVYIAAHRATIIAGSKPLTAIPLEVAFTEA